MELKKLVSQFAYRIEPRPEGGFIAHASDPSIPPLEAPTRDELLKLVQQKVMGNLFTQFPELKSALDGSQHQFAFHVERTPAGGFSIHSADPNAAPVHATTEQDLQSHVLQKILNVAGKNFLPQLAQAIAAQANVADVKVVVKKTSFKINADSDKVTLASPTPSTAQTTLDGTSFTNPNLGKVIDASPITPEPSNFGKVFRLIPVFLLLGLLIFFLLHHR